MTDKKKNAHEEQPAGAGAVPPETEQGAAAESEAPISADELRAELEKTRAQADEYLDGWKRAQADLINYRKRVERDAADTLRSAAGQAAARFFPMLDDFERAVKELPSSQNLGQWASGIDLIYRKGIAALEAEGITPIDPPQGEPFDPNVHEAVAREICPDRQDGEIIEVVHRGYRMGDRVLRPAKVRVACRPADSAPQP
jgi:molecular chaperone GrpE